ncbi:lamin tail domain-containing protein [bacterium]|nr:lamin tail domain-containing protein [bacterium]
MRIIAALILMVPCLASAQVSITEIMYDLHQGSDSGREWIEVYNSGTATVDLTKWKLVESGKNHKISKTRGGLAAGTYAIIADNPTKFAVDHPDYAGALFDSAFSLSNDGEMLFLYAPDDVLADEVGFTKEDGGSGTGDSLQRVDLEARVFSPGIPTPGASIPESGLARTPQVSSGSESKTVSAPISATPIQGEPVKRSGLQIAAAGGTDVPAIMWWGAVVLIALWGAGGIVYARRLQGTEWEIIEES